MSRSDGKFPSYVKLDIHPDRPPAGWNDGARRCLGCKKAWPKLDCFSPSPCCNAQAGVVTSATPDMEWPIAVKTLLAFRFEKYYEKWNEDMTDEQLMWLEANGDKSYSEHEYKEGLDEIERLIYISSRST